MPEYFRPKELADWLGFTEAYIYKLRKQGVLHFEVIDGLNYIAASEVETWISDNIERGADRTAPFACYYTFFIGVSKI